MLLKPLREEAAERDLSMESDTSLVLPLDGTVVQDAPQREVFVPQLDKQRIFTEAQAKCFIRDAAEGVAYCEQRNPGLAALRNATSLELRRVRIFHRGGNR